jgi:DNA-binding NarL/FixJ family response regulator
MSADPSSPRPVRVVVIDDTADLRELLRISLTRGGMEVVGEAGDGLAGIETVRLVRPDVVLLDLSMPVMDGLEALPEIRRLVPDGKIVVLSGFGATQMSERALSTGADGYLQKGMSLKRMLDYVRGVVGDLGEETAALTPA